MKKYIVSVAALAALPGLFAQELAGTWQGSLKAGPQELRIVMKVTMEDNKPRGAFYSIDQNPTPLAANLTRDGASVKFAISQIQGTYDGRFGPDGNTITGTWKQGGGPDAPLNFARANNETAWTIPEPPPPPKPMDPKAEPSFEVATIKPARPDRGFSLLVNRSGMLNTTNTSLTDLIKFAYDLHPKQIQGSQRWFEDEKFDITAKPDTEGVPNVAQLKTMVRKLLGERFLIKTHREQKEMPVYAITVLKSGHKMEKNNSGGNLPGYGGGGVRGMRVNNSSIADWATILQSNVLDRPVVDQTGLGNDRWNFILKWTPDGALGGPGGGAAPPNAPPLPAGEEPPPDIFAAFQQQLGLKLEGIRAPADVLIIDNAAKPSEN